MRHSQHTDSEILHLLHEADAGVSIAEICSTAHISPRTFYRWRERYGGLTPPALLQMKELQTENRRLRALVNRLTERLNEAAADVYLDAAGTPTARLRMRPAMLANKSFRADARSITGPLRIRSRHALRDDRVYNLETRGVVASEARSAHGDEQPIDVRALFEPVDAICQSALRCRRG